MCTHITRSDSRVTRIQADLYATRVHEFVAKLAPNSVAIIVCNPERIRSNDLVYGYRQSSDLLYLNGFPEAGSAVVLTNFGGKCKLILFVRPKDREREIWTGTRVGVEGARERYLADEAYTVDEFGAVIRPLLLGADQAYYKFGINEHFDEVFSAVSQPGSKPLDPEFIVHEMRLFKSQAEIEILRRAAQISAQAHCAAAARLQPGLMEYQIKATMEGIFIESGANGPAYESIIASGNNAVILHYTANDHTIKDGDLVLIDAACELDGYAADITRTLPANGKFSEAQREIYQLVLDSQRAAIRAARPGSTLHNVRLAAHKVLRKGLIKLGILPAQMSSRKSAVQAFFATESIEAAGKLVSLGTFFMHGVSHWLGLDVHDVGRSGFNNSHQIELAPGAGILVEAGYCIDMSKKRVLGSGRIVKNGGKEFFEPIDKTRKLAAGMVFTVEPGLYFDKNDERVPAKYRGIGVRIEDDVVINEVGCEVLTAGIPKSVEEIEQLMANASALRLRATSRRSATSGGAGDPSVVLHARR